MPLLKFFNSITSGLSGKKRIPFLVNIFGLSVSLTIVFMTTLFVYHELSYDKWIPDAERVFRYETVYDFAGRASDRSVSSPLVARDALVKDFAEIEAATRVVKEEVSFRSTGDFFFEALWFVDSNFFDVLDLPVLDGSGVLLSRPNAILISKSAALKYFGENSPIGNVMSEASGIEFVVEGIFDDIPPNSQFNFEFITLYDPLNSSFGPGYSSHWRRVAGYTYLKLRKGADYQKVQAGFPVFIDQNAAAHAPDNQTGASSIIHPYLQPLVDVHLAGEGSFKIKPGSNMSRIYAVSTLAVLTLVIACINYINIAVASAALRAKEVAVRKVVGASRNNLIVQFLTESIVAVSTAVFFALVMTEVLQPAFNTFIGQEVSVSPLLSLSGLSLIGLLTLAVAVISGFYPALVLSNFRPARILCGGNHQQIEGSGIYRNLLVAIQFSVSLVLVTLTIIVKYSANCRGIG